MEYGLIGKKLGHSYSKEIHESFGMGSYELFEIQEDAVSSFLKERNFKGINVTIPYKEQVIPNLDVCDPVALLIGAVNTIVNRNGKLYGYNTDAIGFEKLLRSHTDDVSGDTILILGGTSGTSKAVSYVLRKMGAEKIFLVTRDKERAKNRYPHTREPFITYDEALKKEATILINTTPVGMFPDENETPISLAGFSKLRLVLDVIYHPLRTRLLSDAKDHGIDCEGGLYMLFEQAVAAEKCFGLNLKDDEDAFSDFLERKENIVLIGMPGAGKTTVGKEISKKTGRPFYDTDDLITKKAGKTIPEIFQEIGESGFRKMEKEVILSLTEDISGAVIATGGGSLMNSENRFHLEKNGRMYFLNRDLKKLIPTDTRPLSKTTDALNGLYDIRRPIYEKCADIIIDANGSVSETVDQILNDYHAR